ncbi:MAG: tripartite tricarboxylate transporter permease, partial [Pseudohongiellaceae bacterium]
EPEQAITLMGGIMVSSAIGGSVTAILLNAPGTAPNAATCFDGYPLTRQGKAGLAIGAAATASSVGGIIGVVVLVAILPMAKALVLLFGPPAFFMLAVLGLVSLTISNNNMLRGLVAAAFGLFIGFVGYDDMGGTLRFTAGIDYLWDGIKLVPALIGLFAIAEMIRLMVEGGSISKVDPKELGDVKGVGEGFRAVFKHPKTVLSGSFIGTLVGIVPGVGGTVASFLSYSFAAQTSRDSSQFGKGDIRGVIAPEAANNAKDGGSLIPTLAFGIPGSAEMALFLGVLVLHGMQPGPLLLIEREWSLLVLIIALLLATIASSCVIAVATKYLIKITFIDSSILIPTVLGVALVGAYALEGSMGDVVMAAIFGVIGYVMIRLDYPRITLVIAIVLGGMMERNFIQSMLMFRSDWTGFFRDTTSLVIFIIIVVALALPVLGRIKRGLRNANA